MSEAIRRRGSAHPVEPQQDVISQEGAFGEIVAINLALRKRVSDEVRVNIG